MTSCWPILIPFSTSGSTSCSTAGPALSRLAPMCSTCGWIGPKGHCGLRIMRRWQWISKSSGRRSSGAAINGRVRRHWICSGGCAGLGLASCATPLSAWRGARNEEVEPALCDLPPPSASILPGSIHLRGRFGEAVNGFMRVLPIHRGGVLQNLVHLVPFQCCMHEP